MIAPRAMKLRAAKLVDGTGTDLAEK
jgi:hypothetical protein